MTFLNGFHFRNSVNDVAIDLSSFLSKKNNDSVDVRDSSIFNLDSGDVTENNFFSSRLPEFSPAWLKSFLTSQTKDDSAANFAPQAREDDKAANKVALTAITSDPTDGDFSSQWHLQETETWGINIQGAWKDYVGVGVIVGAADSGFDTDHADLSNNYRTDIDFDFAFNDNDPSPILTATPSNAAHGTSVIGVIGADDNGQEVVGVAPDSDITGYTINLGGINGTVDTWESIEDANAKALTDLDVYNNSWGSQFFFGLNKNDPTVSGVLDDYESLARDGRNDLGVITVFSAGNGRGVTRLASGETLLPGETDFTNLHPVLNVNYSNAQNSPYTIAVAATNRDGTVGKITTAIESTIPSGIPGEPDILVSRDYTVEFSEPGAALLVSAPGVDIVTTDIEGADGTSSGDVTTVSGTSFAAPIISGVVALMLEANANLGYRDVQEILAYSARQNDPNRLDPETGLASWQFNGASNWNGGGLHFSHDYGFGLVDATAAVRLAETWSLTQKHSNIANFAALTGPGRTLTNNATQTSTINVTSDFMIEHAIIDVDLSGFISLTQDGAPHLGDLIITLVSPDGTKSVLLNAPPLTEIYDIGSDFQFEFTSTAHWGESTAGVWKLELKDLGNHVGTKTIALDSWTLDFIADSAQDDIYIYTNEFATVSTAARKNFTDSSGHNIFNAAAITTNTVINLANLTGTLAGVAITFAGNAVVNEIIAGDGADTLTGDGDAELISGMRGNDSLIGGDGNDTIYGGSGADFVQADAGVDWVNGEAGNDNLSGGSGADTLRGGDGADTLYGNRDNDTLRGEAGNDVIYGGNHDDRLEGGDGADWANGEAGNDEMFGGNGNDTLRGGDGADTLYGNRDNDTLRGEAGDDLIYGGNNDDRLEGGDDNDTLFGESGIDDLYGGTGDDSLDGGTGNDTLRGNGGADTLRGNLGWDTLLGGDGNDVVNGDGGNDSLSGEIGWDTLNGGDGNDTLRGNGGNDSLAGGTGTDLVDGGDGNDIMQGNGDADTLVGGNGWDTLNGNDGNDSLNGDSGNDSLFGDNGWDTLEGGAGNDTLFGNGGNDRFVFAAGDGEDEFGDFDAVSDSEKIDLSGMGASFNTFAEVSSASTQVGADVVIDFGGGDSITLTGVTLTDLDSNDFIF